MAENNKIWVKKGYGDKKLWLKIARKLIKYAKKVKLTMELSTRRTIDKRIMK